MFRIGVISDTHGFFDERIPELFAEVDHILHAGDVGPLSIIQQLETIAPVTAVLGNTDGPIGLRLTELVELARHRFLLHHIVNPLELGDDLRARLARDKPHVVVFGHSHRTFCRSMGDVLFLNPGYAGRSRFGQARSVAILDCDDEIRTRVVELPPRTKAIFPATHAAPSAADSQIALGSPP